MTHAFPTLRSSVVFHIWQLIVGRWFGSLPERAVIVIVVPRGLRADFIKRVICFPGDTVAVEGGRVWLNGRPLQRSEMPLMVWPVSPNMPCDGPRYDPYLVVAPDGCRACRSEERRLGEGCLSTFR